VVGNSGSGKSTLARRLAARLDAPLVELDAIFHQPGWQTLPTADFRARVDQLTTTERWIADGNYSVVRELVWKRADTVVWLDLPRRTVMRQIAWRSARRAAFRVELWNGNRERWINLFSRDPEESIIAWAWRRHSVYRDRYLSATADPMWAHLRFIRIRSRRDARRLVAGLGAGRGSTTGSGRPGSRGDPGA
jgi:adenylate kinase family enzyme